MIVKTRGAFSIEGEGMPVIARAGQRLEQRPADPWEECREWIELYKNREWGWRRPDQQPESLRAQ